MSPSTTTSTSAHPPPSAPDATHITPHRFSPHQPTAAAELARAKKTLKASLRQFPDFPSPGILFEDILPIFRDPELHETLIRALDLHITTSLPPQEKVDVVVGLEARGFLFGPSLALRLGAGFVPCRKKGKLPGEVETEGFEKEYGPDFFQVQQDAVKEGQKVLVVDDIIATGKRHCSDLLRWIPRVHGADQLHIGGSALAAGNLVKKLGGVLLGYVFMLELDFLKGREKLDGPVWTLLSSQEAGSKS